jgi:hypothetical protein
MLLSSQQGPTKLFNRHARILGKFFRQDSMSRMEQRTHYSHSVSVHQIMLSLESVSHVAWPFVKPGTLMLASLSTALSKC